MKKPLPESNLGWNDIEFKKLSKFLCEEKGFSFDEYRNSCIERRIMSRLYATRCKTLSNYVRLLKSNQDELNHLYDALTINVSSFFRNKEVFDFLAKFVFPEIIRLKMQSGSRSINIWSVGCSSGEEPYSIAILIQRNLKIRLKPFFIHIKATDIDSKVLEFAKKGVYPLNKLSDIDPKIIRTCFIRTGDEYQILDSLRNMVEFQQQDIVKFEPEETIFDLILCRNMLIYFARENHFKAYNYFSSHLSKGGYLLLGKAEIMFYPGKNNFEHVSTENRVYRKIG